MFIRVITGNIDVHKNGMNKQYHPKPRVFPNVPQSRILGYITGHTFDINYPFGTGIHYPGYATKDQDLNGLPITMHFIP